MIGLGISVWPLRQAGGAANVAPDTPMLTVDSVTTTTADYSGSAFSDMDLDTHALSQWQTDIAAGDFSSPVDDSGEDAVNLLSYTATGLTAETDYKARVRYKDSAGNWSAYSTVQSFTTEAAETFFTGAHFDGINDSLTRDGALTGAVDSKQGIFFCKFRRGDINANQILLLWTEAGNQSLFQLTNTNNLQIFGRNPIGTIVLNRTTSGALFADTDFHTLIVNFDMAVGMTVYVDDVDRSPTGGTFTDDVINLGGVDDVRISRDAGSGTKFTGDIEVLGFLEGFTLDLSVEANRRKIFDASNNSLSLEAYGTDGSNITGGTALRIFLYNDHLDFQTNRGSGGGFTENGELTAVV